MINSAVLAFAASKTVMDSQLGVDEGAIGACGKVSRILERIRMYVLEITGKAIPEFPLNMVFISKVGGGLGTSDREGIPTSAAD
jgi:hypothetical protein